MSSLFSFSRHKWPSAIALLAMLMLWRAAVVLIALGLGYCLPVMGVSLLLFIAVDIVRWRKNTLKLETS